MTSVAFALVLVLFSVLPAAAQAPTGFAEYAWGTNPTVIREQFMPRRCRGTTENRRLWYSLECRDYLVEGLNIPVLRLDFEPADSLAGYYMLVARSSYRAFRDLMIQRFGPPMSRGALTWSGATIYWTWDAVSATLIERCGEGYSCVEVKTGVLGRRQEQVRERERRDSQQSF